MSLSQQPGDTERSRHEGSRTIDVVTPDASSTEVPTRTRGFGERLMATLGITDLLEKRKDQKELARLLEEGRVIEANAFREKKELKVTPKSWIRAGKYCKTQFFNSLRTADAKYENVKMYLISAMLAYLTADAKNKLLYLDIELRMLGLQKEVEDLEDLLAKKYGVDWAFKCDEARDNY